MVKAKHRRSVGGGNRKRLAVFFFFGCFVLFNFIFSWIAGSKLDHSVHIQIPPQDDIRQRSKQMMAPRSSSRDTMGFIHIGKTGGSTISKLLRNGCTSFVKGPCQNITNESIVSEMVEHYYHVPDFHRLPTSNHGAFVVSVRDPFERTVSSFLYHHPKNAAVNQVKLNKGHTEYGPLAYSCFDTLDEFAKLIQGIRDPNQCHYPHRHNVVDATDCPALACATLHGKVRFFVHLFFHYRNILHTKIPTEPPRDMYVLRQEFLWEDWKNLNIQLGQREPVYIPPSDFNQRNISSISLPIGRKMATEARKLLCQAIEMEYEAYFQLLRSSKNLDDRDFEKCVQIAESKCPDLDFRSMTGA